MTEKKGFVLYFDAASSLAALCAEQRGELLLALFDYACLLYTSDAADE